MSNIEWTDETWNPLAGCSIVSKGCDNCYAMKMARRLEAIGVEKYKGLTRETGKTAKRVIWTGKISHDEKALQIPYKWKKPRQIFVNSMSDLFHENAHIDFIDKVFRVMHDTPQHTYQVLTKRPEIMKHYTDKMQVPNNVWLGTSIENKATLQRAGVLAEVNAKTKFLSIEPLLESIGNYIPIISKMQWVIVGGESGANARPMEADWVRQIRGNCEAYKVPFFFKQWGGKNKKKAGRELDGRTYDEYPNE